jgi:hypothetical protein
MMERNAQSRLAWYAARAAKFDKDSRDLPNTDPKPSPEHWRIWAAEMRAFSETTNDPKVRAIMLRHANAYDKKADRAARRAGRANTGEMSPS